jgi:hypothetical protein
MNMLVHLLETLIMASPGTCWRRRSPLRCFRLIEKLLPAALFLSPSLSLTQGYGNSG